MKGEEKGGSIVEDLEDEKRVYEHCEERGKFHSNE